MTKQATLKVVGMHCSGCAASVEKALKGVKGVTATSVNLKTGKALVDYDPSKASEQELIKAVKDSGFGVG